MHFSKMRLGASAYMEGDRIEHSQEGHQCIVTSFGFLRMNWDFFLIAHFLWDLETSVGEEIGVNCTQQDRGLPVDLEGFDRIGFKVPCQM